MSGDDEDLTPRQRREIEARSKALEVVRRIQEKAVRDFKSSREPTAFWPESVRNGPWTQWRARADAMEREREEQLSLPRAITRPSEAAKPESDG